MTAAAASPEAERARNTRWAAGTLLIAGLAGLAVLFAADPTHVPPAVFGLGAGYILLIAASLGLAWAGRAHTGARLLLGTLALAFLAAAALIADLGVLLSLTLAGVSAAVVGLTLARREARLGLVFSTAAALLTLSLDMAADEWLDWGRLHLADWVRDFALPGLAAAVLLGLSLLIVRRFPQYRLSTKLLVAFLGVALGPLALISVTNDQAARAAFTRTANAALLAEAVQTGTALDAFINANLSTVQLAGQWPALRAALQTPAEARAHAEAEAFLAGRPAPFLPKAGLPADAPIVTAYLVLDQAGAVALSTPGAAAPADLPHSALFLTPRQTGQPYASPVIRDEAGHGWLYFSAPIPAEAGPPAGVLAAQVDAVWLERLLEKNRPPANPEDSVFTALFDEQGRQLADDADRPPFSPPPPAAEPALTDAVRAAQTTHTAQTFLGALADAARPAVDHLAVLRPLDNQPWVIMAAQPESIALAPARAQTRANLLLSVVFGLAVAGLSLLAARTLASPIQQLTRAAERVRAGDLTVRPEPLSKDEIGDLTGTFSAMMAQLQSTVIELEKRVAARTAQLQAAADIGRATAGVRDLDELLALAVDLVAARFGCYHAFIFLVDEAGESVSLRAAAGPHGAALKAQGYRLTIGARSVIGWVTQNRQPRLTRDVTSEPLYLPHPLLAETRSEVCLPLLAGGRLLGALDAQSREADAFAAVDLQALQVLADQLSIAIENAQLFRAAQTDLAEARALYLQTLEANWRLASGSGAREWVFNLEGNPPEAEAAADAAPVLVPIRLRERAIGVIELHGRPAAVPLSAEEAALLDTVAAQLAAALENAALIRENQVRSRRERLITAITDQMRATLNPALILQTGIRQLGRALGGAEVTVRLQPPAREGQPKARGTE